MKQKKYRPNVFAGLIVIAVTVVVCWFLVSQTRAIKSRQADYDVKIAAVDAQLEEANEENERLEEQSKYVQTKNYILEIARSILGLVDPNEILVRPADP